MLEIVHSNRTERLVATLASRIEKQRALGSVLAPIQVVVPNRNLETYLNLSLAQAHGVSAGLDFVYLEELAARAVGHPEEVRVVDRNLLKAGLLALFHDAERLQAPELAPVREYLEAPVGGGGDADLKGAATDLRRVQLADQLSALLENHQWTRPAQVAAWLARPGDSLENGEGRLSPRLLWQAHLWQVLLGPEGVLSETEPGGPPPCTLASRILDPKVKLRPPDAGRPIHLFGLSYFGLLFHHLLARLAREGPGQEIWIYGLNPTRHYWDAFVARRDLSPIAGIEGEDPLQLSEQPCLPLGLWGKPGGEHLRLLREVAGGEQANEDDTYTPDADAPEPTRLLHRVQRDLLEARPPTEIAPLASEEAQKPESLCAIASPSLRREVEVVADRIWSLLPELRFHEVAVVVPPAARERYLPIIGQVFEAHHRLPHTTADLSFAARSPLASAALLLLELPFGRFTRAELLRLMTHPAFDAGAGLPAGASQEIDPARFSELAEAAGIYFGRDDDDLVDTYLGKDAVHWAQGLTRLALGQSLGGPRGGEPELLYRTSERCLAPEDLGIADPATTRAFGLLASSLLADLGRVRREEHTLGEWAQKLRRLLQGYLKTEDERDQGDLVRILTAIDSLSGLQIGETEATKVSGRTACTLAASALAELGHQQGPYLSEGVVVSTFLPMRAIPFRAIFVLGLGEGVFPGPARRDPLDLRAARQAGDHTTAERDRHAFLETLLCARDRLCLSWVARDETTGDPLAPSSVLLDLLEVLRPYLGESALQLPSRSDAGQLQAGAFFGIPPLRRHEDPDSSLPEALAEREAARLGREETDLSDEAIERLLHLRPKQSGGESQATGFESDTLSSGQLLKFLETPVQGAAKACLGLREDDEGDEDEVEDEPLEPSRLQSAIFRREAFEAVLRAGPEVTDETPPLAAVEEILERAELLRLRGQSPRGPFASAHLLADLQAIFTWRALLAGFATAPIRRLHLGSAREDATVDLPRLPALALEPLPGTLLRLSGVTSLLAGAELDLILPVIDAKLQGVRLHRSLLRAALDHLLLCASDRPELCPAAGRRLLLIAARPGRASFDPDALPTAAGFVEGFSLGAIEHDRRILRLQHLPADEARTILCTLIQSLLTGPHDRLLPLDVIAGLAGRGLELDLDAAAVQAQVVSVRSKLEKGQGTPRSAYGPVPDPFALEWLENEDAAAAIAVRFAPLYELLTEEAGP